MTGSSKVVRGRGYVLFSLVSTLIFSAVAFTPRPAEAGASVTSSVRTVVAARFDLAGATISLIQICPIKARLNRVLVRAHITSTPPGYRLASRELWPRGMVTRWRITAPTPQFNNPALPTETVFCDEDLRTVVGSHDAAIQTIVRLWGPTPVKAELDAISTVAVLRNGARPVPSTPRVQRIRSKRLLNVVDHLRSNPGLPQEVELSGFLAGQLRARNYAELAMQLLVRSGP